MLFNILPKDPVTPFITGNTLQIIVISVFVSVCIILLDDKVLNLKVLVEEGALLFQRLMSFVCGLIPVFVFAALTHQIWSGDVILFAKLWKPLCLSVGITVLLASISLAGVAWKNRVSPFKLFGKYISPFFTALTTASSISAFSKSMESCNEKCGVDKSFLQFCYPIGSVIYMPATVVTLCILPYTMAEMYDIQVSLAWIIMAAFTAVFLAIAAPPIPGAALMVYTILFAQLGIPKEGLLLAAAIDLIIDYVNTGFNVLFLLIETVDSAGRLGRLNRERLSD